MFWLLPDPAAALRAWRAVAPVGRLVVLESLWGDAAPALDQWRSRGRRMLCGLRGQPPEHHGPFDPR